MDQKPVAVPASPDRVKHQNLLWRIEAGVKKLTWQILISGLAVVVATNQLGPIWLDRLIPIGRFSASTAIQGLPLGRPQLATLLTLNNFQG
jgi:hypothetical protein